MNIEHITQLLNRFDYGMVVLAIFFLISLVIAVFNIIYLNQSLHVATDHMGIRAPIYLRQIIKIGIFVALLSAGFSLFVLFTGMY